MCSSYLCHKKITAMNYKGASFLLSHISTIFSTYLNRGITHNVCIKGPSQGTLNSQGWGKEEMMCAEGDNDVMN